VVWDRTDSPGLRAGGIVQFYMAPMSTLEKTTLDGRTRSAASTRATTSPLTRLFKLASSVRLGIVLLLLLVVTSMIGMLVMQQTVGGFEDYYAELSPTRQLLWGGFGFFDIYHSWYFTALLTMLALNIVLASIDRFPRAWTFISRPKLDASATWLKGQPVSGVLRLNGEGREAVADRIAQGCRCAGLKAVITRKGTRAFVFAEHGAWNRLGAYAVHVALLTILTGGFVTAQYGRTGYMPLTPGKTTGEMFESVSSMDADGLRFSTESNRLPFSITCTDIQQKLIRPDGPLTPDNTLDWLTRIQIKDESGTHDALVHLNRPYDYRGYRFFQASFINVGRARTITLRLMPQAGDAPFDVTIPRDGATVLADGTRIEFAEFLPDFKLSGTKATTGSGEYRNPAAVLNVTSPSGVRQKAYVFSPAMADLMPAARNPVAGYMLSLASFERVPDAHVLSIQKDPGANVFYLGGAMLALTLLAVFLFSHQRVWALIEQCGEREFEIVLGANTNRNLVSLEDRFKRLTDTISGCPTEVCEHE
jgi:cytochrome c biogenesis protein